MQPTVRSAYYDHPSLQAIRPLLLDPLVTEIMINGAWRVFVERGGVMLAAPVQFRDEDELMVVIRTLLQLCGREISASVPYMDFRLPDGSRGNVVIPPLALNGAVVTIRKFTRQVNKLADLVACRTLSNRMAQFLIVAIRARANMIFAGAAGTGKTTTLGLLAQYIPPAERIITIEDTAELQMVQPNVVRLECRRPNMEGKGEVTLSELVRNSLRMRPTRIVVGEIRGEEAGDMIQAITSGHQGCLAVVHGSTPEDTISRLEVMLLSRGLMLPLWAIHRQIASAIDLVVQQEMLPDGTRKVTRITEITGMGDNQVNLRDVYAYQPKEGTPGVWACDGTVPRLLAKCQRMSVPLPAEVYAAGEDA